MSRLPTLVAVTIGLAVGPLLVAPYATVHAAPPPARASKVFLTLPRTYNTIDGMALAPDGRVIVAVPNYNNMTLEKEGRATAGAPARLAIIDPASRTIRDWYIFQDLDLSPETGKAAPMGLAFGPDGNLYYVDRQSPYRKGPYGRIGRIIVRDGKPLHNEFVVEGGFAVNDLAWHGNRLYVTDAAMMPGPKTANMVSGVLAFSLDELDHGPVRLKSYDPAAPDPHLIATFVSNNKIGAGADGITIDDAANLYIGVNEEGTIWKIALGSDGQPRSKPILFARDPMMISADGMVFDPERRRLYIADFLGNAVHAVSLDGSVTTLQKNDDADSTSGQLDQPCAVLLLGDRLLVSNMDYVTAAPGLAVNAMLNDDHALSVIDLDAGGTEQ